MSTGIDATAVEDSPSDGDILRRHFVAIATGAYRDSGFTALPVDGEVHAMRNWWCGTDLGHRRFTEPYPHLANNPSKQQIRDALEDPPPDRRWRDGDAAVVFVTGHGVIADNTHFLVLQHTEQGRPTATAIRSADLVAWLAETRVETLLLILDSCHAGKTAWDLMRLDHDLPSSWLALSSTSKNQTAVTGALTGAVTDFLDLLAAPEGAQYGYEPLIDVHDFLTGVQQRLGDSQALHLLDGKWPNKGGHPCLPNPHYRADRAVTVEPARKDLALPRADLHTHWGPRARGVARDEQPGWLFTGRAALMAELIAAVNGPLGVTVVTGGAGSGKSAVLARLVTLTDPAFLSEHADRITDIPDDLRPRPGAVDVAVVATGKLHTQVLAQICHALGVTAPASGPELGEQPWLDALHTWLHTCDRPVTIVVDAFDEADSPITLLSKVLTQLDPDQRHVRLLIGVRSTGTSSGQPHTSNQADLADLAAGPGSRRIAVDTDPWWQQQDLIDYTASILTNLDNSPYRDAPDRTATTAHSIGTHAGRSFLLAQIAATSLAEQPATSDPGSWRNALDQGITGVFSQDLHQSLPDPDQRYRAVILLRAAAFARGPGIPWRYIWPRIARAVDEQHHDYGDTDVAWLLNSRLGGYLITDRSDDTSVYRLFHDLLRDTLRTRWRELLQPPRT